MTEEEKRKMWPSIVGGVILLLLFVSPFAILTLRKYRAYEKPAAVPRLRENIGNIVVIPRQSFTVLGKTHTSGPNTGVLQYVGYRFNDRQGFFDCEIRLGAAEGGGTSVHTGLSPEEVLQVEVIGELREGQQEDM
jgi:hypothetical protein